MWERDGGSKSCREEGGERAILGGKIELGFARVSRLLFASVIRLIFQESNDPDRARDGAQFLLTSLVNACTCPKFNPDPRGDRRLRKESESDVFLGTHLEQKERNGISNNNETTH